MPRFCRTVCGSEKCGVKLVKFIMIMTFYNLFLPPIFLAIGGVRLWIWAASRIFTLWRIPGYMMEGSYMSRVAEWLKVICVRRDKQAFVLGELEPWEYLEYSEAIGRKATLNDLLIRGLGLKLEKELTHSSENFRPSFLDEKPRLNAVTGEKITSPVSYLYGMVLDGLRWRTSTFDLSEDNVVTIICEPRRKPWELFMEATIRIYKKEQ